MTIATLFITFININTGKAVTSVSVFAKTTVSGKIIGTQSIFMTGMQILGALVDVFTGVARLAKPDLTVA